MNIRGRGHPMFFFGWVNADGCVLRAHDRIWWFPSFYCTSCPSRNTFVNDLAFGHPIYSWVMLLGTHMNHIRTILYTIWYCLRLFDTIWSYPILSDLILSNTIWHHSILSDTHNPETPFLEIPIGCLKPNQQPLFAAMAMFERTQSLPRSDPLCSHRKDRAVGGKRPDSWCFIICCRSEGQSEQGPGKLVNHRHQWWNPEVFFRQSEGLLLSLNFRPKHAESGLLVFGTGCCDCWKKRLLCNIPNLGVSQIVNPHICSVETKGWAIPWVLKASLRTIFREEAPATEVLHDPHWGHSFELWRCSGLALHPVQAFCGKMYGRMFCWQNQSWFYN